MYWKKKPVERKGCFKNHWKAIIGGAILCLAAIAVLVFWVFIWYNAIEKYITLRACYMINYNPEDVTEIVIDDRRCWGNYISSFDVSRYKNVKRIEIGNGSFLDVSEVEMIGLNELESVVIGEGSFMNNDWESHPNSHFYLKNCPKLKSLKIGEYSFEYYNVFEIENVDALEVIEMSSSYGWSSNFAHASTMELKSIVIHKE